MATARNADKRHGHTEMNIASLVQPSVQTPQPRDVAFEPNLAKDTDQVIVPVPGALFGALITHYNSCYYPGMTSVEMIDALPHHTGASGILVCQPGRMDADKTSGSLEKPDCSCKLSKGYVEVLLDISEENSVKEQEAYDIPDQAGWDEAVSRMHQMHLLL